MRGAIQSERSLGARVWRLDIAKPGARFMNNIIYIIGLIVVIIAVLAFFGFR
jgi:small-conductance mechanosensitive channel